MRFSCSIKCLLHEILHGVCGSAFCGSAFVRHVAALTAPCELFCGIR